MGKGILKEMDKISKTELLNAIKSQVEIIKLTGDILRRMGINERDNKKAVKLFQKFSQEPSLLYEFLDKMPEKDFRSIMLAILKLMSLSTKTDMLKVTTPEKKIKAGEEIIALAEDLKRLIPKEK